MSSYATKIPLRIDTASPLQGPFRIQGTLQLGPCCSIEIGARSDVTALILNGPGISSLPVTVGRGIVGPFAGGTYSIEAFNIVTSNLFTNGVEVFADIISHDHIPPFWSISRAPSTDYASQSVGMGGGNILLTRAYGRTSGTIAISNTTGQAAHYLVYGQSIIDFNYNSIVETLVASTAIAGNSNAFYSFTANNWEIIRVAASADAATTTITARTMLYDY